MLKCKKDGHQVFLAVVIHFPGQCVNYTIFERTEFEFYFKVRVKLFFYLYGLKLEAIILKPSKIGGF